MNNKDPYRSLTINSPSNLWQIDKLEHEQLHNQAKQQLSHISYFTHVIYSEKYLNTRNYKFAKETITI